MRKSNGKLKWVVPKLTVLLRKNNPEQVLSACKMITSPIGGGPLYWNGGCDDGDCWGTCFDRTAS